VLAKSKWLPINVLLCFYYFLYMSSRLQKVWGT
jgi:hypothetical protein